MTMYIYDLTKHGEYLDYNQSWLVVLTETGNYLLGDKEVKISYNPQQFFIEPNTVVQKVTHFPKTIKHYLDTNGLFVSRDCVDRIHDEYRTEEFDYIYPNLEVEFEHRKQLEQVKSYTPVYEQKEDTFEIVNLKCVGHAEDTGSKYITTAISYGKKGFGNSGFYKVDYTTLVSDTFWQFVKDNELGEGVFNKASDCIRFVQIKGKYVFNDDIFGTKDNVYKYHHNLQEAKEQMYAHQKSVIKHLKLKVFGETVEAHSVTLSALIRDLENIKSKIRPLQCKVKSIPEKQQLIEYITKKIDKYKDLIDE